MPDNLVVLTCDSITFNVVGGEEKYYIIDTFEQFKAINTNTTTRGSNSRYIMRQNVDCVMLGQLTQLKQMRWTHYWHGNWSRFIIMKPYKSKQ